MRLDLFIVWNHGLDRIDDILAVLRRHTGLRLVYWCKYTPPDIRAFVEQVYSADKVPIEHLRAKNEYLYRLPGTEVALLICQNRDPDEQIVGEGEYRHTQSMTVDRFKWDVRERFNPVVDGQRSEQHVIHGTDNEFQTKYIWSLVPGVPAIEAFHPRIGLLPDALPYHLPSFGELDIQDRALAEMSVYLVTDGPNSRVPLADSPHVRYLRGDRQTYIDYWNRYKGHKLTEDHSPGRFDELAAGLKYPPPDSLNLIIIRPDGAILDGNHRAAVLLSRGLATAKAIVSHDRPS